MQTIRRLVEKWYTYPILLLLVGGVSYLYQLTQMGFYWDDWQAVLLYQIKDPSVISTYFSYDRPFSAWTYQLLFPFLPMRAWVWQLFTMLIRGLAILALIKAFLLVWPKRRWLFNWVGLLLFVAPALFSEPISVAFYQHFLTLLLFASSLLFTGLAITKKRWYWVFLPLALITTAAHLFTMEYFVGLEALRLVYIYILIKQNETHWQDAARKAALTWIPFGVITALFIIWRLAIYPDQVQGFIPNDPIILKQFISNPGQAALDLITRSIKDILYLFIHSWVNTISLDVINFTAKANLFSWAIGLVVAVIAAIYLFTRDYPEAADDKTNKFLSQGLFTGAIAVVFGGLPVWLMARQITEGKWSDRFSLAPMIGAVIILVIIIDRIIRTKAQKHVFLTLLLGLSIAAQMRNVNKYRLDWDVQRQYYWQLSWRIPSLKSQTAIFSPGIPSERLSDYATAFAINRLYADNNLGVEMPYWFITPRYLDLSTLEHTPDQVLKQSIRNIYFSGSTANMVSVYYESSERCLKVLDEIYSQDPMLNNVSPIFFNQNNNSRIASTQNSIKPAESIFGKEPGHDWCYYFEKADLARQNQQWNQVTNLMDEAFAQNLKPATGSELLPLLDAYSHLGNWDQVTNTAIQIITITQGYKSVFCTQSSSTQIAGEIDIPQDIMHQIQTSTVCE